MKSIISNHYHLIKSSPSRVALTAHLCYLEEHAEHHEPPGLSAGLQHVAVLRAEVDQVHLKREPRRHWLALESTKKH